MYKFRLQPLQKIRENTRRERQADLARALEAEAVVREKIESLVQELDATKTEGRRLASEGKINVDFLVGLRRHEAWLLVQKQEAEQKLEQVLTEVERRRLALVEADKEVKVLEKLHEKLKEKHDAEMTAREVVELDEIASVRAARR
jgi:flagellar export protein FliJ